MYGNMAYLHRVIFIVFGKTVYKLIVNENLDWHIIFKNNLFSPALGNWASKYKQFTINIYATKYKPLKSLVTINIYYGFQNITSCL